MLAPIITFAMTEARRLWCCRWLAAGAAALIALLGVGYVAHAPNVYDAWGQIYVNSETPLSAAAQGVALTGANYGSPYLIQKTFLNDSSLERIVERLDPGFASKGAVARELEIGRLRAKIHMAPDPGEGFVELHVTDTDPARARLVAELLIEQFIADNLARASADLTRADRFIEQRIGAYETLLDESQRRIAGFRRAHPAVVPGRMSASGLAPGPSPAGIAAAARAAAQDARVAELETRLANLRTAYTEDYPDVVGARRQLADALAEQATRHVGAHQNPRPAPREAPRAYAATSQIMIQDPTVAASWSELEKNHEMLQANYEQLVAKRAGAEMSRAVYGADNGKYQVTRRPTLPTSPTGPNRPLLLAVVAAMAVAGGLGVGYLRAAAMDIFVSTQELETALQLPVIGTVSREPAWHSPRGIGRTGQERRPRIKRRNARAIVPAAPAGRTW